MKLVREREREKERKNLPFRHEKVKHIFDFEWPNDCKENRRTKVEI